MENILCENIADCLKISALEAHRFCIWVHGEGWHTYDSIERWSREKFVRLTGQSTKEFCSIKSLYQQFEISLLREILK